MRKIACVTGATGIIGSRIVSQLHAAGYEVRGLSRSQPTTIVKNTSWYLGSINDIEVLQKFLKGAHLLFHCAAELSNEQLMEDVNVAGTERLSRLAAESGIQYFCYLSSAGVTGKVVLAVVDEETPCLPQNCYEFTKWEAENIVRRGIPGCKTVILRPTNVVAEEMAGFMKYAIRRSWKDFLFTFIKGGECAHIIHADDVAAAAMFFIDAPTYQAVECFNVSCDEHPSNSVAGIWSLVAEASNNGKRASWLKTFHLPWRVAYLCRLLLKGSSNKGCIRYSSEKIHRCGFRNPVGLLGAVKRVISKGKTHGNS